MTAIRNKGFLTVVCSAALLTCGICTAAGGKGDDNATAKVFDATWEQTTTAITNAFALHRYHEMALIQHLYQFDRKAQRWSRIPTTNEWGIYVMDAPVTELQYGKKQVPYFAEFDIKVSPHGTNQCLVQVTTVSAWIPGGLEIGIHGGLAKGSKHIEPVRGEETNVLTQIEIYLSALKAGTPADRVQQRDSTPRTDSKLDWREIGKTHPAAKDELIRAIQSEPNAGLRGELLKVLERMTNNPPAKSSATRQP